MQFWKILSPIEGIGEESGVIKKSILINCFSMWRFGGFHQVGSINPNPDYIMKLNMYQLKQC